MNDNRAIFTVKTKNDWGWDDAELNVASTDSGLTISVEQEKAVDSYNETFECVANLTYGEAKALSEFLINVLSAKRMKYMASEVVLNGKSYAMKSARHVSFDWVGRHIQTPEERGTDYGTYFYQAVGPMRDGEEGSRIITLDENLQHDCAHGGGE